MSKVKITNIRALPNEERNRVKSPFQSFLARYGVYGESSMSAVGGEIFGIFAKGRRVGGVWIRLWPGQPGVGDAHVVLAPSRFADYDTLVTFDLFLRERERIMGLKRWRVIVAADNHPPLRALGYLGFVTAARQSLPGIGDAVILEREVM